MSSGNFQFTTFELTAPLRLPLYQENRQSRGGVNKWDNWHTIRWSSQGIHYAYKILQRCSRPMHWELLGVNNHPGHKELT